MSLLRVTEAFADFSAGRPEVYNPGRLVDSNDPIVKGREGYFEAAEAAAERVRVEQATAAPGERRGRSRARKAAGKRPTAKKAAAKKAAAPKPTPEPPAPASEVQPEQDQGDQASTGQRDEL